MGDNKDPNFPFYNLLPSLIKHRFLEAFIFLIVVDDKGGIGKSLLAQLFAAMLGYDTEYIVKMLDTDFSNSTTAQTMADTKMVDLNQQVAKGTLLNLLRQVEAGSINHIVMDVGAREEAKIKGLLPWLAPLVHQLKGRIVIVRPITLGSHNQAAAANFMTIAQQLRLPVVFVRNQGQGRVPDYFERWLRSKTRDDAIARGAFETAIEDANVLYTDEAVGFGLSIADCAMQNFSKLEDADRAEAEAFFNEDVAAFLGEWLRSSIIDFGIAVEQAIAACPLKVAPAPAATSVVADAGTAIPDAPTGNATVQPTAKAAKAAAKPRQA